RKVMVSARRLAKANAPLLFSRRRPGRRPFRGCKAGDATRGGKGAEDGEVGLPGPAPRAAGGGPSHGGRVPGPGTAGRSDRDARRDPALPLRDLPGGPWEYLPRPPRRRPAARRARPGGALSPDPSLLRAVLFRRPVPLHMGRPGADRRPAQSLSPSAAGGGPGFAA